MAHGKTLELKEFSKRMWALRYTKAMRDRGKPSRSSRDRTLAGKKRVKARKAEQRADTRTSLY